MYNIKIQKQCNAIEEMKASFNAAFHKKMTALVVQKTQKTQIIILWF